MAGQDWSIKIIPSDTGAAAFVPDLRGAQPGTPLQTENADLVSWNNRTAQTHQPWPADAQFQPLAESNVTKGAGGNYLSDPIPPWQPSTPAYQTTAPETGNTTVYYCCKLHPQETGTIVISAS